MIIKVKYILILGISFIMSSCLFSEQNDKVDMSMEPIVSVDGKTLYQSDLDRVLPSYLSEEDSINAANEYIRIWVSEALTYERARKNTVNEQTIDQLVEDYRRALITNSYRERILKEHFIKSTSESKLREYYNNNLELFKLEKPIIKGLYLKIPSNSSELDSFKKLYRQNANKAVSDIEKLTLQNAVNYEYFYDKWLNFPELMNNIPYIITDADQFLKNNNYIEQSDSSYVYLLNISEYKQTGELAPYEYIKDKLPEIYIEKNRATYIKRIQDDMYNKAVADKKIKYYNK